MSLADNAATGSSSMWTTVHGRWKKESVVMQAEAQRLEEVHRSCGSVRLLVPHTLSTFQIVQWVDLSLSFDLEIVHIPELKNWTV